MKFFKHFFRYCPPAAFCLLSLFLIMGTHFVIFSEKVDKLYPPVSLSKADAIIVLTGGERRIETGLRLLKQGLGSRLLISGVNATFHPNRFVQNMHVDPQLFECCVDLGYQATNTKSNAEESAVWIKKHNYKTLYIVTHDYHIARSLLELRYLMPDINFIAYPIKENVTQDKVKQLNKIRMLASEYIKNIGFQIRSAFQSTQN
ncbi:YdcF family protein [Bartonella bacilliformis]|nr:YdcF family protein [Bartonella bacilliformis]